MIIMQMRWFLLLLKIVLMLLIECGISPADLGCVQFDETPDTLPPTPINTAAQYPTDNPTSTQILTSTFTPLPSNNPTQTPTPQPIEIISFLQYNIGGGITPYCSQYRSESMVRPNTFEAIAENMNTINPDFLAINITYGWIIQG